MANFSTTTKHPASDFNGGVQYGVNDQFSLDALNASIENGLYAANQADNKTTITNSNGDIITSIKLFQEFSLLISVQKNLSYF